MNDATVSLRRENLATLAAQYGGRAALARKTGKKLQAICGMLDGQKSFGERIARDIEATLGLKMGALDEPGMVVPAGTAAEVVDAGTDYLSLTALEPSKEYPLINYQNLSKIRLIEMQGDWLYEQPVATSNPDALRLMSAPSDNMEPLIKQGATVVVDTAQRSLTRNGMFAMAYSGSLFIHRVQIHPGNRYVLLSDNPQYQPIVLDNLNDIFVIGRCILLQTTQGI